MSKAITLTKKEVEEAREDGTLCLISQDHCVGTKGCRKSYPAQYRLCKKLTQFAKGGEDEQVISK